MSFLSVKTTIALVLFIIILFYIFSGTVTNVPVVGEVSEFIAEIINESTIYISDIIRDAIRDVLQDAKDEAVREFDEGLQGSIDSI